jgi:sialic acid synthase SpsE
MSEIIIDMGSGNTCKNDSKKIKEMIDAVVELDTKKHQIIFKWQLFMNAPPNKRLTHGSFEYAYEYALMKGYKTTSSVFDITSLSFLLGFHVPFIKIPCRPELYWLIGEIPRKYKVFRSFEIGKEIDDEWETLDMACVPKYPAKKEEYIKMDEWYLTLAISDHTGTLDLFKEYKPEIWECHFVLEKEKDNPDSVVGITPDMLKEIL